MPETIFDRIPVNDSSFAHQKYITRVGLLDLFCGLDVKGDSLGEIGNITMDIPFDPKAKDTVGTWLADQGSQLLADKADTFFKGLIWASPSGLSWLENEAFDVLKDSGDKDLYTIIVVVVKNAWDQFLKALSGGLLAAAKSKANKVLEIMKDERMILHEGVKLVAKFIKSAVFDKIRHGAEVITVARRLCFLTARTCHTVYNQFGPTAYSAGIPRQISGGIYLGRALSALLDSARVTNAAYSIAASYGCVVAWPIKVAASLAHKLLTLFIRMSERLRLGRLIGYAKVFATDHGYSADDGAKPKFVVPTLDSSIQKLHERDFDEFYNDHINWFPAAAGLALLVPHGVGDAWSYLNLGSDPRYWLSQGGKVLLNEARFNAALEEMEYLRRDARLYLNAINLTYTHPRFDVKKAVDLRVRDDPVMGKGLWYYIGLIATHGYAMN